jgi:hypothetical protein
MLSNIMQHHLGICVVVVMPTVKLIREFLDETTKLWPVDMKKEHETLILLFHLQVTWNQRQSVSHWKTDAKTKPVPNIRAKRTNNSKEPMLEMLDIKDALLQFVIQTRHQGMASWRGLQLGHNESMACHTLQMQELLVEQ